MRTTIKGGLAALTLTLAIPGLAGPAGAQEAPMPRVDYLPAVEGANAADSCRLSDDTVMVTISVGGDIVGAFPNPVATRGACVSTLEGNALSAAAYAGQCKDLEAGNLAVTGQRYPMTFYGQLTASNRSACMALLEGFHTAMVGG